VFAHNYILQINPTLSLAFTTKLCKSFSNSSLACIGILASIALAQF